MIKIDKVEAAKLLESDETFAFTLMVILLATYDQEVFDENPVILFSRIESDFRIKLPEEAENRINAVLTAMTTDLFYTQFSVFKSITLALCEGDIGDDDDDELNAAEILWAITEVGLLNGDTFTETQEKLSDSVAQGCNNIIDAEAEDSDESETDLEDAIKEPYYQKFVTANLLELAQQLLRLKVPTQTVEEILKAHNRSLAEL